MSIVEARQDRSPSEIQNPGIRTGRFQQSTTVPDLDEPAVVNRKGRRGWPIRVHGEHVRVMHDQRWVAIVDASDRRESERKEDQRPSSQPWKDSDATED